MAADWTQLPPELVEAISKSLTIYTDYLHFRAVCRTWRSFLRKTPDHLPPQLPWLMVPQAQSNRSYQAFFDLSTNNFRFLNVPEASHRKRLCGSSHGWLVILDDDNPTVLLVNPLTRSKTHLPPLSTFPNVAGFNYADIGREYVLRDDNVIGGRTALSLRQMRDWFIKKVVLSSSPLQESNFVAVSILYQTGDLAYCSNGDQSWKIIENAQSFCEDVICFNGLFYAVNKAGQIAMFDVGGNSLKLSLIETPEQTGGDMQYLVGSGDDLLLVTRYLEIDINLDPDIRPYLVYRTMRFEVSRLDLSGPRWERLRSLGDRMLFIGGNSSLSLLASDFSGCMGDCIYYTDDYSETNYDGYFGEHDLGIFKLWDGSLEPLPCYPRSLHGRLQWPPPIWVSPSPC